MLRSVCAGDFGGCYRDVVACAQNRSIVIGAHRPKGAICRRLLGALLAGALRRSGAAGALGQGALCYTAAIPAPEP